MTTPLFVVYGLSLMFQNSHFGTPAGSRPVIIRNNAAILPGGRIISPKGEQLVTGPGTFGLAVSPGGKILTANLGPDRSSLTVAEKEKRGAWMLHNLLTARAEKSSEPGRSKPDGDDWKSVSIGTAFAGEKSAWIAEGDSGRVRLLDLATGNRRRTIDINTDGFSDSFTGDLIADDARGVLFVTDQANFRVVAVDTKRFRTLGSVKTGRLPFALALSEDAKSLYVTHIGVFDYKTSTAGKLPFPALAFSSPEAVAAFGDANSPEANSLAVIDIEDPAAMKVTAQIRTGLPFAPDRPGGSGPFGVAAGSGRIFVSNTHDDSITIIDAKTLKKIEDVGLRIPGQESLRGLMPAGLTVDPKTGNLLVACAGINALAVLNFNEKRLSLIPVGWFPVRVSLRDNVAYVANAKGHGTGPNTMGSRRNFYLDPLSDTFRRGSVSVFPMPAGEDLKKDTQTVFNANGFTPLSGAPAALPKEIRHVVLMVKESRSFDEIMGDFAAPNPLARFGMLGIADGSHTRLSVKDVSITPNHHAIAKKWVMGDNFYTDSEASADGHHWLVGNYPDPWTVSSLMVSFTVGPRFLRPEEIQEEGTVWHHLERNNISFRNFGEGVGIPGLAPASLIRNSSDEYPGFNMKIPDQSRANHFIQEIRNSYEKTGKDLPQFLFIYLPNDYTAAPRPENGFPFGASYIADNDYALGRILEYLSQSPWWKEMAVFVTESDSQGGRDHIDSHRTVLLGASPWMKRGFVSHTNTSFPGLLKTIFRLLNIPPLNLYDATASDLSEMFTEEPDFSPYKVIEEDARVFVPAEAKE